MEPTKFKILSEELQTAAGFMPGNHSSANDGDNGPVVLAGSDGTGDPEFTDELICFNGDAKNDNDHETFYLPRVKKSDEFTDYDKTLDDELCFDFTKTNRKPYDIMVQISMLRLKHHFPECRISSDGDSADWKNGKKLYKKLFKESAPKLDK